MRTVIRVFGGVLCLMIAAISGYVAVGFLWIIGIDFVDYASGTSRGFSLTQIQIGSRDLSVPETYAFGVTAIAATLGFGLFGFTALRSHIRGD